jgi:hypothetical protein
LVRLGVKKLSRIRGIDHLIHNVERADPNQGSNRDFVDVCNDDLP